MALSLGIKDASPGGSQELTKKDKFYVIDRKFKKTFLVLASLTETEDQVMATVGVPAIGVFYLGAMCIKQDPQEMGRIVNPINGLAGILWEIACEFSNDFSADNLEDTDTPPTSRRPKVSWSGEQEEEEISKDVITKAPIQTTAGEKITATHPICLPILNVERYENWPFEPLTILNYVNKVNSAIFYGSPIGTALMLPIQTSEEELDDGSGVDGAPGVIRLYVKAHYSIKFKLKIDPDGAPGALLADTWMGETLNQGHIAWRPYHSGVPGAYYRIVDDKGDPKVGNLTAGTIAAGGGQELAPDVEPNYIRFNRFGKVDFNILSLGPYTTP